MACGAGRSWEGEPQVSPSRSGRSADTPGWTTIRRPPRSLKAIIPARPRDLAPWPGGCDSAVPGTSPPRPQGVRVSTPRKPVHPKLWRLPQSRWAVGSRGARRGRSTTNRARRHPRHGGSGAARVPDRDCQPRGSDTLRGRVGPHSEAESCVCSHYQGQGCQARPGCWRALSSSAERRPTVQPQP